jgi:hypothetical protein
VQRLVRDFVSLEQLRHIGDVISELPRHGDHDTAFYPAARHSCAQVSASPVRVAACPAGDVRVWR